jgi:hypothetical protein
MNRKFVFKLMQKNVNAIFHIYLICKLNNNYALPKNKFKNFNNLLLN